MRFAPVLLACATVFVAGCSGNQGNSNTGSVNSNQVVTSSSKIKHIVIIMQENRSFDNLFEGFPGADTVTSGMSHGKTIQLQPVAFNQGSDLAHSHTDWWTDWDNGAMDGFSRSSASLPNLAYSYVPQSETKPYWTLAQQFTLGDRMFQSNTGPSFVAHQYMIAGQSGDADEDPDSTTWGCDAPASTRVALVGPNGTDLPGVFPCFDYKTMADLLDAAKISWRYYAPSNTYVLSAFQAIHHIRYGSDWTTNIVSPNTQVLTDIANGQLAEVTWIVPSLSYSDHPGSGSTNEGPSWVGAITNAIGASRFWNSTAIFISWDDWGGWYDHVSPPQVDNMGYGFRVPVIIVSPYARPGYISHVNHEASGILTYIEEVFGLPSLGARDTNANDFRDCFDYTQTPLTYTPLQLAYPDAFFRQNRDNRAPDDD